MSNIQNICVFCGSKTGNNGNYIAAAQQLGKAFVENGKGLVYGGGSTGLMGVIADSVLAEQGRVIGVIPKALREKEVQHNGLTELVVVDTMHERKAMMAEKADAFIAMPGGMGTFEELFEIVTWAQLGIHQKPIAVLNVDGYYDPLKNLIAHTLQAGFTRPIDGQLIRFEDDPAAIIPRLQVPADVPFRPKWMDIDQM